MNIINLFFKGITPRKAIGVVLGNIILGVGIAILRFSTMGNDPYTASTLAISDGLHVGLGNYQLALNIALLIIQLIWGRAYLGFGTIINMCFMGYIVQFTSYVIYGTLGTLDDKSIVVKLIVMAISLLVLTFGLSMYQVADLGVAPFDFISLGLAKKLPIPYLVLRIFTDMLCVMVIIVAVLSGLIGWENSHLGLGTVIAAFCLGPFINFYNKYNQKWIR